MYWHKEGVNPTRTTEWAAFPSVAPQTTLQTAGLRIQSFEARRVLSVTKGDTPELRLALAIFAQAASDLVTIGQASRQAAYRFFESAWCADLALLLDISLETVEALTRHTFEEYEAARLQDYLDKVQ